MGSHDSGYGDVGSRNTQETADTQFKHLIATNADGMLVLTPDGTILFANLAAQHLFQRDSLIGQPFGNPLTPDGLTEIQVLQESGVRVVEMHTSQVHWNNAPAVLASLRDITEHRRTQEALQEALRQTSLLTTAINSLSIGAVITDPRQPDNPIIYTNPAFEQLTGYSSTEVVGRSSRLLLGAETNQTEVQRMREVTIRREIYRGRLLNYRKDGSTFWNQITISPVFDEEGTLIHFIGLQQDVTAEVHADAQLQLQGYVMDNIGDAVLIVDSSFRITYCNNALLTQFDLSRDQVIGRLAPELYSEIAGLSADDFQEVATELMQKGAWNGETTYQIKGQERIIQTTLTLIGGISGTTSVVVTFLRDVTEQRRREREIRQQNELLEKLFADIPVMIAFLGKDGRVHRANPHWEKVTGYTQEQAQSLTNPMEVFYPDPEERQRVLATVGVESSEWYEFRPRTSDGRTLDTLWANINLSDGTSIGIGQDITERKRLENELRSQNELLQTIFDNIPVMVGLYDQQGHHLLVNRYWEELYGWTLAEVQQHPDFMAAVLPDEAERVVVLQRIVDGITDWRDSTITVRDGRTLDTMWANRILPDGRRIAIGQDISARKRLENELREQKELLQTIIDNAPVMISYVNADGVPNLINRHFEQVTGWTAQEIAATPDYISEFYPDPDDLQDVLAFIEESSGQWRDFKSRMRDGQIRDVQWVTIKLPDGSRLGLGQDITERKQLENELREKTEFLETIIDNIPMMIELFDSQMRLQLVNRHWTEVLGWSFEEAAAHPNLLAELYPRQAQFQDTLRFIADGTGEWRDFMTRVRDGRYVDTRWANVTLSDGRHIGIGRDVTEQKKIFEQLRYQSLVLENVSDAIISVDMEYRIKSWNHGAERIYGWLAEEALGQTLAILRTDVSEAESNSARSMVAQVGHWSGEVVQYHRDGTPINIHNTATLLHDENGTPIGLVAVNRDITAIKKSEETLREVQQINQSILDSMTDGLTINSPDGIRININPALTIITGFAREEIVGRKAPYPYWPDDQYETIQQTHEALMRGEFNEYELIFQRKNGERFPALVTTSGVRGADGQLKFSFSIVRDITTRKAMEVALREQRQVAETLRATALLVAGTLDADEVLEAICVYVGRVVENDVACLLVLRDTQLIIERSTAVTHKKLAEAMQDRRYALEWFPGLEATIQRRIPLVVEDLEQNADWRLFRQIAPELAWMRSSIFAPITVDDRVIGFLNVGSLTSKFYNYTHAHILQLFADQAAVALKNARLYEEMSVNQEQMRRLSHQVLAAQEEERRRLSRELHDESGQALTALKIQVDLLRVTLDDPASPLGQQLAAIAQQVDQTAEQIRHLSHQLRPPTLDTVSLSKALEGYCKEFAKRTRLAVTYNGIELPDASEAVKIALYRILQEALTNVTKHAAARNVWVKLEADAETVEFSIRDDGHGFARPKPSSNSQLVSSQQNHPIGRGVGVVGMRERIELLGGRFNIDSTPGQGVSVVITLPLETNS